MTLSREEEATVRQRQRSRNLILGLVLAALVVLFYGITIARMGG